MKKIIFLTLITVLFSGNFPSKINQPDFPNIYIDASAGNGGDGSLLSPYNQFSDINWATKGDNSIYDYVNGTPVTSVTINLKRGEIWREQLTVGTSGTAIYPIIIQAYGNGAIPVITGANLVSPGIELKARSYCIYSLGNDYITIDGLKLQYANRSNRGAITIAEEWEATSTGWTVQNCEIKEGAGSGIFFYAGIGNLHDTLIDNNIIHDNGVSGIRAEWIDGTSGNENTVSNNTIYNNPAIGIQCVANYWIIESNTIYGNGSSSGAGITIQNFDTAGGFGENCIVRYNLIYNQNGAGNDGSGIILDYLSDNNEVYHNIVYGNWGSGIDIYSASNATVFNNTVYGNVQGTPSGQRAEIRVIENGVNECSNVVIKNNIAQATESNVYAIYIGRMACDSFGLSITNNDWYASAANWYYWNNGGGNSLATWNALAGIGADSNEDPLLTDPVNGVFTLHYNSPLNFPNIGAYEFWHGRN